MAPKKILIVEDEQIIAADIKISLEKDGYKITGIARSSVDVFQSLEKEKPDLILMDIHIKGDIDGIETTRQLSKQYTIPVIFLTAYSDNTTLHRANLYNSYGFLLKPFQLQKARIAIDRALYKFDTEKEVIALKDKLEATLLGIGEGVILVDSSGYMVMVNPVAAELIGVEESLLITKSFIDFFKIEFSLDQITNAAKPIIIRASLEKNTGEMIPIECNIRMLTNERFGHGGAVIVFRDISNQLAYEKAMVEAKNKAEEHNRAKSEFLANISHELRTPLNSIIGMSKLVRERLENKSLKDFLAITIDSAEWLLQMISNLLNQSKIESKKLTFNPTSYNLGLLVEESIEKLAIQAGRQGITLILDIPNEAYNDFLIDTNLLYQVLTNLVGNAIKFTEKGYICTKVRIESNDEAQSKITILIEDTGIGMSPIQLEKIFADFYQIDSSKTRAYGGTGLGLSITKNLTEIMGGVIEVESNEGVGSCFSIIIPSKKIKGYKNELPLKDLNFGIHLNNAKEQKSIYELISHWGGIPSTQISQDCDYIITDEGNAHFFDSITDTKGEVLLLDHLDYKENDIFEKTGWKTIYRPFTRSGLLQSLQIPNLKRYSNQSISEFACSDFSIGVIAEHYSEIIKGILEKLSCSYKLLPWPPGLPIDQLKEYDCILWEPKSLDVLLNPDNIDESFFNHPIFLIQQTKPHMDVIKKAKKLGLRGFIPLDELLSRLPYILKKGIKPVRQNIALDEKKELSLDGKDMQSIEKLIIELETSLQKEDFTQIEKCIRIFQEKNKSQAVEVLRSHFFMMIIAARGSNEKKVRKHLQIIKKYTKI